jgi:hypothetical protein
MCEYFRNNKKSLYMKKITISLITVLFAVLTLSPATAQQESGKDLTTVPAIAESARRLQRQL